MNSFQKHTAMFLAIFMIAVTFVTTALPAQAKERTRKNVCEDITVVLDSTRVEIYENERFEFEIETKGGDVDIYDVDHLPRGLSFDEDEGTISGRVSEKGTYRVEITASNECDEDTAVLRIVVKEKRTGSTSSTLRDKHDITLESRFVPNDEKGYVYLTQIPYTGAGDVLRISLIALALTLWGGALGYALLNPEKKERIKNIFVKSTATAYAPESSATIHSGEVPFMGNSIDDEEVEIMDAEELQILRSKAHEDKVLFSEDALKTVITKSQALGGPSLQLLTTVIDGAKATYPREDGFIKINSDRMSEILA